MKGRTYPINPTAGRMLNHMARHAVTFGALPSAPCGAAKAMAWWTRAGRLDRVQDRYRLGGWPRHCRNPLRQIVVARAALITR